MTPITHATPVGILGLGIVGSRIVRHLRSQGWNILAWNRTPLQELPNDVDSPEAMAQKTSYIVLYLKNKEACLDVVRRMRPYLDKSHVIINHSTIDLPTVQELNSLCTSVGATYWDAPFTGSKLPAERGQLAYYVSGPLEKLPEIRDFLAASSKAILEFGTTPGQATVAKLVTNLISAITVEALSEALSIMKSYDMSGDDLLKAMSQNVCSSGLASFKLPLMDAEDFTPHFSLDNMRKDSVYVRELADAQGIRTPAIDLVSERMQELCDAGMANADFCSLMYGLKED